MFTIENGTKEFFSFSCVWDEFYLLEVMRLMELSWGIVESVKATQSYSTYWWDRWKRSSLNIFKTIHEIVSNATYIQIFDRRKTWKLNSNRFICINCMNGNRWVFFTLSLSTSRTWQRGRGFYFLFRIIIVRQTDSTISSSTLSHTHGITLMAMNDSTPGGKRSALKEFPELLSENHHYQNGHRKWYFNVQ